MFQFPSNGKAYPKVDAVEKCGDMGGDGVSIPFKRESLSKGGLRSDAIHRYFQRKFQFPSNGKAYPKWYRYWAIYRFWKRLFQFPSNGKAYPKESIWIRPSHEPGNYHGFNSLQTGKPIQRKHQPKNLWLILFVSIPFKRESLSKAIFCFANIC